MARYEYQCGACSSQIEITRSMEDSLSRVPYCETCLIPMKRIYTSPAVQFKGDGWAGTSS